MTDDDLGFASAVELRSAYRARTLSPVEVARTLLERVEALDPRFDAMTMLTPEIALAQAREAESAYAGSRPVRPLEGVPVTIKDMHPTRGLATSMGSLATRGWVPDVDAPCIARLHAAGTVTLGKTTVPEFGWKGVSQSTLSGVTHNPWRHGYNAGASSAAAAAAAAAGFGPLHLGSDGGGFAALNAMSEVAGDVFRRVGLNLDYQALDWGTVLQRDASQQPAEQGGWHVWANYTLGVSGVSPAANAYLRGIGKAATFGWPTSPGLEGLRDRWLAAPDLAAQRAVCRDIQALAFQEVPYLPLGAFYQPTAYRSDLTGMLKGFPLFWNVRRG